MLNHEKTPPILIRHTRSATKNLKKSSVFWKKVEVKQKEEIRNILIKSIEIVSI